MSVLESTSTERSAKEHFNGRPRTSRKEHKSTSPRNPWVPIPRLARLFLLGGLFVFTAVCVTGALLNSSSNPSMPVLAASTAFYLAMVSLPLVIYDKEKHGWFHPLFFSTIFCVALKGLPRSANYFINGLSEHAVLPLGEEALTRLVAFENLLQGLALASMYWGYHFFRNPVTPRLRTEPPKTLWLAVAAAGIVSAIALGLYIRLSGSLTQHILNLSLNQTAKVFEEEFSGVGHLVNMAQWFAMILIVALAYRPALIRNGFYWGLCIVALVMVYLASGKRSILLAPIAIGSIVYLLRVGRVPLFRMALVALGMIGLFLGLSLLRGASMGARSLNDIVEGLQERSSGAVDSSFSELNARAGSYSSAYPIYHYVPNEFPLLLGESYLTIIARPIPRALWPDKPRGTDFRAGALFFNAAWGIPPGAVAEAYWNFHIPGVIVVYFLFGLFLKWIAELYVRHQQSGVVVVLYVTTLFALQQPAENSITGWMLGLLPLLIFGFATKAIRFGPSHSLAALR